MGRARRLLRSPCPIVQRRLLSETPFLAQEAWQQKRQVAGRLPICCYLDIVNRIHGDKGGPHSIPQLR